MPTHIFKSKSKTPTRVKDITIPFIVTYIVLIDQLDNLCHCYVGYETDPVSTMECIMDFVIYVIAVYFNFHWYKESKVDSSYAL